MKGLGFYKVLQWGLVSRVFLGRGSVDKCSASVFGQGLIGFWEGTVGCSGFSSGCRV